MVTKVDGSILLDYRKLSEIIFLKRMFVLYLESMVLWKESLPWESVLEPVGDESLPIGYWNLDLSFSDEPDT
jgi:hypothetical protein